MTQYILLIHGNEKTPSTGEEWDQFFVLARQSGFFEGGSAVGKRMILGDTQSAKSSNHIVGYMRFDAEDKPKLLELLKRHPVVMHGGSVELCELPKDMSKEGPQGSLRSETVPNERCSPARNARG